MSDWRKTTSRRDLLRAAAAAGVSMPLLRSAAVQAETEANGSIPKRLIVLMAPNGVIPGEFRPNGTTLASPYSPLQPYADKLLFVENMDLPGNGNDPHNGQSVTLTGVPHIPSAGDPGLAGSGGGISMDQRLADALRGSSPVRSYSFGVHTWGSGPSCMSYRGAGQPVPVNNDPRSAHADLFGGYVAPDDTAALEAQQRQNRLRRKLLDFSTSEVARTRARLSRGNRIRLEQHEQALSELSAKVDNVAAPRACTVPTQSQDQPWGMPTTPVNGFMMDAMLNALACGITNVATFSYGMAGNYFDAIPDLHHREGFDRHMISHESEQASPELAREDNRRIYRWVSTQVKTMLDFLANHTEHDGSTMLDHTTILWTTEVADIGNHAHRGMKYVLAGDLCGKIRTGGVLEANGAPQPNFLLALLHAYGIQDASFGNSTGVLPGLLR